MRNPKQRPLNSKEEEEEIEYLKHLDRCHVEQTLIPAIISGINAGLMTKGELFDIASWKKMIINMRIEISTLNGTKSVYCNFPSIRNVE